MRQTHVHGGHLPMPAQRYFERVHLRRRFRIDPELIMKTLKQLHPRLDLPGQLLETLVLLIGSWKLGVDARLTVVVAQVLVSPKEPQSIVKHRSPNIRCQVTIPVALISADE